jgi:hypothetical protein
MSKQQKIWAAISGLIVAVGLIMGFWPQTVDVPPDSYGVHCGSPFAPASAPEHTSDSTTWGQILDYQPNGTLADSPEFLHSICGDYMDDNRAGALVVTALGVIGAALVGSSVRTGRRRRAQESRTAAATAEAEQEAYWRAQGYVPPEEVVAPPPGWQRAED